MVKLLKFSMHGLSGLQVQSLNCTYYMSMFRIQCSFLELQLFGTNPLMPKNMVQETLGQTPLFCPTNCTDALCNWSMVLGSMQVLS